MLKNWNVSKRRKCTVECPSAGTELLRSRVIYFTELYKIRAIRSIMTGFINKNCEYLVE